MNSSSEEEFQVVSFSSPAGRNQIVVGRVDRCVLGKAILCLLNMNCWKQVLFENVATIPFSFSFLKKS